MNSFTLFSISWKWIDRNPNRCRDHWVSRRNLTFFNSVLLSRLPRLFHLMQRDERKYYSLGRMRNRITNCNTNALIFHALLIRWNTLCMCFYDIYFFIIYHKSLFPSTCSWNLQWLQSTVEKLGRNSLDNFLFSRFMIFFIFKLIFSSS